jgi:GNAT superfamily N-acetyltransferase
MSEVLVREARITDATAVAELSGMLGYPVDGGSMEERLGRAGESDKRVVFVAESEGALVGWVEGAEHELLVTGRMAEICGLVVAQGRRTSGIGRRLIEALEDWARRRGLDFVTVRSNAARTESHPFYERVGYARLKTQHVYRKSLALPER